MTTISKTSTFEVPKFSQRFFSQSVPLGSACGLGHGAAAPEAEHHWFWQPRRATMGSSSGSSRPRRWWMRRRTKRAVASDEDLGETSWGNGIFTWGSGWNVDSIYGSSFYIVDFCFQFLCKVSVKTFAAPFCFALCGHDISRLCPLSTLSCLFLWSDFRTLLLSFGECPPL